MKFKVECKLSNAAQIAGENPHDEIADNFVGDYIDAETAGEAIELALDYIADSIDGFDCEIYRNEKTITVYEHGESAPHQMYWGFTADLAE